MTTRLTAQLKQSSDVGRGRNERIVRDRRVRSPADRNLHDYFREYIVVQRHHKYIVWTLRACFTSRQNETSVINDGGVFKYGYADSMAILRNRMLIYAFKYTHLLLMRSMNNSILLMFLWIYKVVSREKKSARAFTICQGPRAARL